MGLDPALFFHLFWNKWINKILKSDIERARRFGNVFRFIDDLTALCDYGEFDSNVHEIYPPELELRKANPGYLEGSFLDI